MAAGWIPFCNNFSAADSKLPAMTTTEVVPSPASISCAWERWTNYVLSAHGQRTSTLTIFAAGCTTCISFRIVAPSLVTVTLPSDCLIILSKPLGPSDVRTAEATPLQAATNISYRRQTATTNQCYSHGFVVVWTCH